MKEDYPEAGKWIARAIAVAPSPGTKAVWYWVNAWISNWCGNLKQADASLEMSKKLAITQENQYTVSGYYWLKAFMERDLGRYDSAEAYYSKAFQIFIQNSTTPKNDTAVYYFFTASVKLAQGKIDSASWYLDRVRGLLPEIHDQVALQIKYWYDCTYADILCAKKDYRAALEYIQNIKSLEIPEFTYPQVLIYNIPFNRDFLARAYEGLGKTDEAIAEYQKLITFDPDGPDRLLINPMYHYSLAKLYEKKGQADLAVTQYRRFLELWKDADPVFTEPAEARKRIEALSGQ